MSNATIAPFGTWKSPIDAKMIAEKSVTKEDVLVDPISSILYHVETRAGEGGRNVVVESESGTDLFGADWNARARVHEYGGAPAAIFDGILIFSNFHDGQIYMQDVKNKGVPKKITSSPAHRFADFVVHPRHPHLVVCILEDHTHDLPSEVVTSLVTINTNPNTPGAEVINSLMSGADFYSSPRFNDDGSLLAWCQWNHPDMPWDGCQVSVAGVQVTAGQLALSPQRLPMTRLAGEPGNVSAVQPTWVNTHTLVFSSDISGYHNPWVTRFNQSPIDEGLSVTTSPLFSDHISQDFADPSWWLGTSNVVVLDNLTLLFSPSKDGRHHLCIARMNGDIKKLECPYVHITRMRRIANGQVAFLGSKDDESRALIQCSFDDSLSPSYTVVTAGDHNEETASAKFPGLISLPQPMTLTIHPHTTSHNNIPGARVVHVLFFPPCNLAHVGSVDEKPCAIVSVHGGPTSVEWRGLNMQKQFFTSRGWAWIDVNYTGSSNYGRKYADRLKGNWGTTDVEDCAYAVKELSSPKYALIDPDRVVIRGGSAGGFVVLRSLCQADPGLQVFAAGTASYGVSDLRRLSEMTHKFQSWYVQNLVGGTYDQKAEVYNARSPVFHTQNIKVPLLILQGSTDLVVPPSQSEAMVKAIQEQGGNVEYHVFDGEGHGWRKAETIESALEKEAAFYSKVFRFSQNNA